MTIPTYTDDDRRSLHEWIQQIPDEQRPLFNSIANMLEHERMQRYTSFSGVRDLFDQQHADQKAMLLLLQTMERRLTETAADVATLRGVVAPLPAMLVRLDSGLTILEGLEQADVQHLAAVIGPPDPDDPRTIHERLKDQDAHLSRQDAQRTRIDRRMGWLTGAVAVLALILFIFMVAVVTAPPPVFGGMP